jgi:hypothetical protein
MIISHKYKFIFIHIPKCAGSSVSHCIRSSLGYSNDLSNAKKEDFLHFRVNSDYGNCEDLNQHEKYISISEYFKEKGWNIDDYFKFSFVRNPWARRVSQFEYAKSEYERKGVRWAKEWSQMDFAEFLQKKDDLQFNWISQDGEISIDFVGKSENLQEDMGFVLEKIGIQPKKVWRRNKNKHKRYQSYYNDELKQIVQNQSDVDINQFGYKFSE